MKVKILTHTPNPERLIAICGKLCYAGCSIDELEENLTEEEINKFVNMLIKIGHESPLEHVSFTFAVEGVSRVTEQQLTRHRLASYSIQSGRYVERDNAKFTIPKSIQNHRYSLDCFNDVVNVSKDNYNSITESLIGEMIEDYILKYYNDLTAEEKDYEFYHFQERHTKEYNKFKKKAIEDARMVFPNSLQTKIIFTMNLRSLINFFEHRCCFRAQDEIRKLANEMLKLCKEVSPILFNRLGASCKTQGYCPEGNMQCDEFKGSIPQFKDLYNAYLEKKQKESN
jgi:thymidylate synthase (FAD)